MATTTQNSQFKLNNNYLDDFGPSDLTAGGSGNSFSTSTKRTGTHALSLNGSGDARLSDSVYGLTAGNADRSITAWIRAGSSFNGQTILALGTASSSQEFTIQLDNLSATHRILVNLNGNNVAVNLLSNLSLNTFYWLAVTYTSSTKTSAVYINNVLQGSAAHASNSNLTFPATNGIVLGDSLALDHTKSFTGYLDDVRIYNSVLSSGDRSTVYNSGGGSEGDTNTGWKLPNATANTGAGVTSPGNAVLSDDSRAVYTDASNATADYYGFDFSAATDIKGIEIMIEGGSRNSGQIVYLNIQLSWDSGGTWSTAEAVQTTVTGDQRLVVGGPTDTWGHTWSTSELANGVFRMRAAVDDTQAVTQYDIDSFQGRVFYSAPTTTSTSTSTSTTTTSTSTSTTTTSTSTTRSTSTTTSTTTTKSVTTSTSTTTTSTSTTTTSTSTTTTSTSTTTTSTSTSITRSTSTSTTQTVPLGLGVDNGG